MTGCAHSVSTTMPPTVRPTPPFSHRLVVGTIATLAGIYVLRDAGKDFEYVKFEPHSPEEIERRKREGVGLQMRTLETRTLDYTPEAKARLKKLVEDQNKKSDQNNDQSSPNVGDSPE